MKWRSSGGAHWLEADLPGAKAVFSTRATGSVKESHEPLASALGLPVERIAMAHQVHGAELVFHGTDGEKPAEADGHVISDPGPIGLVFTADCLPVAVAGPNGVAILHCGWRGLAAGIVTRGVEAVGATDAAVGPGIGPCCYEVGGEVLSAFARLEGIASGRMLDLSAVAHQLLSEAGVERIESAGLCTSCEERLFFSHRREADIAGRQGGLVWLDREAG